MIVLFILASSWPESQYHMKYVYILKAGENQYKVGISNNVKRRVAGIQTSNGLKIFVVGTKLCENAASVEKRLHNHLREMGSGGGREWFTLEPEDVLRICILLNMEPEIDVYANVDLNKQLVEQNIRHKRLEKKLDALVNIAQRPRATIFNPETSEQEEVIPKPNRVTMDSELVNQAIVLMNQGNKMSTSYLQRHLQIGYGRASRIVDELERQGYVGPLIGIKREVLTTPEP